jgi:pimeloyl-ACP methyl ester carboxylesterase
MLRPQNSTIARRKLLLAALGTAIAGPALAAKPLPAQKTLLLFGARIRYFELGQGPTLVLVHGLGSSAQGDWGQVMQTLAKTHHILALDLLGFGGSDKPAIDYGIQTWVDFLGEFLRAKKVTGGFTLMGESLGGWIAAQYTIQALGGVAPGESFVLPKPGKLVLCDAAGHRASMAKAFEPRPPGAPIGASIAGEKSLLSAIFHSHTYGSDEGLRRGFAWSLSKGDSGTIKAFYTNKAILDEAIDGKLAGITIPTLVVWGEHDRLIPLADGQSYASGIAGAQLVVIPDSGHAPMIETPAAFLQAVQPFLSP